MALYLMWAATVPSDPAWGLGGEFSAILAPVWRIVIASIVAEMVSELLDTEIYHCGLHASHAATSGYACCSPTASAYRWTT